MKSALFVDFDNVYSGLRKLDQASADRFARRPTEWMNWVIDSLALPEHARTCFEEALVEESLVEEVYLFEKVLGHYRAQRWEEAERLLAELATASPSTKLYKIFRERIFQYRYNPPDAGWNGVWVFKTK